MDWTEAMRRIGNGEPVQDVLDEKSAEDDASFRAWLLAEAGSEALARYDANRRDLNLGLTGARNAWHSLSPAQRRVLTDMAAGRAPAARIATLRALAARDLLAWEGGAFTPEAAVALTERGRFVVVHGEGG